MTQHNMDTASAPAWGGLWEDIAAALRIALIALFMFAAFLVIFIAERHLLKREVIFYDGLQVIAVTAVLFIAVWLYAYLRTRSGNAGLWGWARGTPQALILFIFIAYSFVITVPALLDRSISFFMISIAATAEDGKTDVLELQQRFVDAFVLDGGAIEKRLNEQLVSGNMAPSDGGYVLTERGEGIFALHMTLVDLFNVDWPHADREGAAAATSTSE